PLFSDQLFTELMTNYGPKLRLALLTDGKHARREAVRLVKEQMIASVPVEDVEKLAGVEAAYAEMETRIFRDVILNEGKRLDGRAFAQIRPIDIQLSALPRTHGSAIFTRGETQA